MADSEKLIGEGDFTYTKILDAIFKSSVALKHVDEWRSFGETLQVEELQLEEFRKDKLLDKLTYKEIFSKILQDWRMRNGKDATLKIFLTHLNTIGWKDLHDQLVDANQPEYFSGFKETLPPTLTYYVKRKVYNQCNLTHSLFKITCGDIFVFIGLNRSRLSELTKKSTDTSSKQVYQSYITVQFMVLGQIDDWAKLSKMTSAPLHLIKYAQGKLVWMRSNGDMNNLRHFIDTSEKQLELSEEEFIAKINQDHLLEINQPICLADSPGMGKSVLLAEMGRHLQTKFPNRYVAFIIISEWINKMAGKKCNRRNINPEMVLNSLLEMIADDTGSIKLKEEILSKHHDEPSTKLELMFDGFDEISPENFNLAYECLKTLRNNYSQCVRIWVTTRLHLLIDLENCLSVIGYNIKPLDDHEQLNFLTSFWTKAPDSTLRLDKGRLENFAETCLSKIKEKLNKSEQDIAGIPLQCLLIGEIFEDDAISHAKLSNHQLGESLQTSVNFNFQSIAEMYENLIAKKIGKFIKTHPELEFDLRQLMNVHVQHSLNLIFPDSACLFADMLQMDLEESFNRILDVGILESSSTIEAPRFIHRTFAEYLVAWCLLDIKLNNPISEHNFSLLSGLTFASTGDRDYVTPFLILPVPVFIHSVICCFVNWCIRDEKLYTKFQTNVSTLPIENRKNICRACIFHDFFTIFKSLYGLQCETKINFDKLDIYAATKFASLEFMHFIFESFEGLSNLSELRIDCNRIQIQGKQTLLHVAVHRREFAIVEYLLKNHSFKGILEEMRNTDLDNLLHYCLPNSLYLTEDEVEETRLILSTVTKLNPNTIDCYDNYDNVTPILCCQMHVELMIELVKRGANLEHQDRSGNTALHNAGYTSEAQSFQKLLQSIPQHKLNTVLHVRNREEKTVLHVIFDCLVTPSTDVLVLLEKCGADFTLADKHGTILHRIARIGDYVSFAHILQDTLIQEAISIGQKMDNLLHSCVEATYDLYVEAESEWGERVKIIRTLVAMKPLMLKFVNEHNEIPLLCNRVNLILIHELIDLGSNVFHKDEFENTFLHKAIQYCSADVFHQLLVKLHNGTLNEMVHLKNKHKHTILDKLVWQMKNPKIESLELLHSCGANFSSRNSEGKTLLHGATKLGNLCTVDYLLLKHGFETLVRNGAGVMDNLLHCCVEETLGNPEREIEERIKIIETLHNLRFQLLGSKSIINGYNVTPLFCFRVNPTLLIKMITLGADILNQNSCGETFLHNATLYLTEDAFHEVLLSISINNFKKMCKIKSSEGNTILHAIVKNLLNPKKDTFKYLKLSGADFNCLNKNGESILDYAIKATSRLTCTYEKCNIIEDWHVYNLLEMIIEMGSNPEVNNRKMSALHSAAAVHNFYAVQYFVRQRGMEVNLQCVNGMTPLDTILIVEPERNIIDSIEDTVSQQSDRHKIATLLKEGGAMLENYVNGYPQIHRAIQRQDAEAVKILLKIFGVNVNEKSCEANTALHQVFLPLNQTILPNRLFDHLKYRNQETIVKILMEEGADINILNGHKQTAFMLAIRHNPQISPELLNSILPPQPVWAKYHLFQLRRLKRTTPFNVPLHDLFLKLVEMVENVKDINKCGSTFLHLASKLQVLPAITQLLVTHKLDVNSKNNRGNTPLHEALRGGQGMLTDSVKRLLQAGGNVNSVNNKNETPLVFGWKSFGLMVSDRESQTDILIKLIRENNLDISIRDNEGNTALHLLFSTSIPISPNKFHNLVEMLKEKNALNIFNVIGGKFYNFTTPMNLAVKKIDIEMKTLQLLKSNGVDFNAPDNLKIPY